MEYDCLKIKSKAKELEQHPGYLPWMIRREIDIDKYHTQLERKGLFDKLRDKLSESKMSSYKKHKEEFIRWMDCNPEYSEFLIEE